MVLEKPVEVVRFSADGRTMLAAGGEVRVWPTVPGFGPTLLDEQHAVHQIAFSV